MKLELLPETYHLPKSYDDPAQPYVQLDLNLGRLTIVLKDRPDEKRVLLGSNATVREWQIAVFSVAAANALLRKIQPFAQELLNNIEPSYTFNGAGERAWKNIDHHCKLTFTTMEGYGVHLNFRVEEVGDYYRYVILKNTGIFTALAILDDETKTDIVEHHTLMWTTRGLNTAETNDLLKELSVFAMKLLTIGLVDDTFAEWSSEYAEVIEAVCSAAGL